MNRWIFAFPALVVRKILYGDSLVSGKPDNRLFPFVGHLDITLKPKTRDLFFLS